ncbi:NAD(P)-dependent oxidoreductase [uncultured Dokdonia sp.]|uniref:NAD(P)-dependent oxidoreductase n=1 Tax=uncultured Dokdonia sp. TaxID=575653 RepID=UPI0026086CAF|nr:NAD(P)-dependent oxidoreductase [uncultured Dokdonia sp.]
MKTLIYSAKDFEIPYLEKANQNTHTLHFTPERLTTHTAMKAVGYDAISIFSADDASPNVLEKLKAFGVSYITLRSAGYDNVNIFKAQKLGLHVANAADYSPHAIAEHAITLLLAINRKIIVANKQVQQYDFTLSNLVGIDLKGKTIGIIGTGRIGAVIIKILHGFETTIIATDIAQNEDLIHNFGVTYMPLQELCKQSDVVILSVPLNAETHHLMDKETLAYMKPSAYLINVARGAIVDTKAVLESLNTNVLKGYATDVYAHESGIFFYDRSSAKPNDLLLDQLLQHPNVILTPHQAFATQEALTNIATTTMENLTSWEQGKTPKNELT